MEKNTCEGRTCGDDCFWNYDEDSMVVIISGDAPIGETSQLERIKNDIKRIVIGEGITKITSNSFNNYPMLEEVSISSSVTEIQMNAFTNCPQLKEVRFYGKEQPNPCATNAFDEGVKIETTSEYTGTTFCGITVEPKNEDDGKDTPIEVDGSASVMIFIIFFVFLLL